MIQMFAFLCYILLALSIVSAQMPSIVFVMLDDVGMNDMGYNGGPIPTPYINELSGKGIRLTNYYVHPTCTPTRAALMSGRYGQAIGLPSHILGWSPFGIDVDYTLPSELKKLGYGTYMSGKWHLGFSRKKYLPTTNGFDEYVGMLSGASGHFSNLYADGQMTAFDWMRSTAEPFTMKHYIDPRYSTTKITANAIEFLQKHSELRPNDPAFLYVAFQACHTPIQALPDDIEKCQHFLNGKRRGFCAQMQAVDRALRDLVEASIENLGENTIIILSSDNGGYEINGGSNWPYRSTKTSPFEGGSKVPAFITDLSKNKYFGEAGEYKGLMHISDFLETLVRLAAENYNGEPVLHAYDSDDYVTDGVNQLQAIRSRTESNRNSVFLQYDLHINITSYIFGKWKFIEGNSYNDNWYPEPTGIFYLPEEFSIFALISELWQMTWDFHLSRDLTPFWAECVSKMLGGVDNWLHGVHAEDDGGTILTRMWIRKGQTYLFDLEKDPYEWVNVADSHPGLVRDIRNRVGAVISLLVEQNSWEFGNRDTSIIHKEPDTVCDVTTGQDENVIETSTSLGKVPCLFYAPFLGDEEVVDLTDPKWQPVADILLGEILYNGIFFFFLLIVVMLLVIYILMNALKWIFYRMFRNIFVF